MGESGNGKTSMGLEPNIAALLCYVAGFITGIIFYVLEKENKFVKFHAMQSTILSLCWIIISYVLGYIPLLGLLLGGILGLGYFILWIILMVKAYNNEWFKLPIIGDIAEKQMNK